MIELRGMRLIKGETEALFALFKKTLPATLMTVALSFSCLVAGMFISLQTVDFGNYAVRAGKINQLILSYMLIAGVLIVLLIFATVVITYIVSHSIIAPVIRIARELNQKLNKDPEAPDKIRVRESDIYLLPLVDVINKII